MTLVNKNSERPLLDKISSPNDLKNFSTEELEELCKELREELIESVSTVGGHFSSSLGVVELTVCLHKIFNTPEDQIVWDVGHQSYIHKILTSRREALKNIRQYGGISGFPKRSESKYDAFGVAHAGTSISAAAGLLEAFKIKKEDHKFSVAVIGDGAMTCGMAFEALNHTGLMQKNQIVVLNDNEMSISPNVGAVSLAFSKALSGKLGTSARKNFKYLKEKKYIPNSLYRLLDKAEEAAHGFLSTPAMMFASFGYRYIGPVDGHDVSELISALENAKKQDGPVLVHVITTKGKGYTPAEIDPEKYHGVKKAFNKQEDTIKEVEKNITKLPTPKSYTDVFGETMVEICKNNRNVVGITAAMAGGTGLIKLAKECPDQFYDGAIAEQHCVTFAAGLACEGIRPVCAIYSTFLQRAYDQVVHDVCIQSLPVIFAMDRAGLVGADGPTHHGVFDIGYLRILPNMISMAPKDEAELVSMLYYAVENTSCPISIRYPRGAGSGADLSSVPKPIALGKGEVTYNEGVENLIIAIGQTVETAISAADTLKKKYNISSTVINARFIKPLDEELISSFAAKAKNIITVEDGAITGGFGSAVIELLNELGINKKVTRLGIPDRFIDHGTQAELIRECGYDKDSIITEVLTLNGELKKPKVTEYVTYPS